MQNTERKYKDLHSEDFFLSKYAYKAHGIHSQKKQMFLKHCLEVPFLDLVDASFYSNWIWKPDSF